MIIGLFNRRHLFDDFPLIKWPRLLLRALILPLAVTFTRFDKPLCVFFLGIFPNLTTLVCKNKDKYISNPLAQGQQPILFSSDFLGCRLLRHQ
jgi:hypothetical protein